MDDMNLYESQKRLEVKNDIQKFTIKVYGIILAILLIGGIYTLFTNPMFTVEQRRHYLILMFIYEGLSASMLIFGLRTQKHHGWVDVFMLIIGLSLYGLIIYASKNGKIINLGIFLPVIVMFMLSTLKVAYSIILLLVHSITVLIFYQFYPSYTFLVDMGSYINVGIVILILAITTVQFVKLIQRYQDNIFRDMSLLDEKNLELAALNEEYYATQEELNFNYDQVQRLAFNDSLTGAENRVGFERSITGLGTSNTNGYYFVVSDLHRFKDINSVYGYDVGDDLLKSFYRHISDLNLAINTIARFGGDVFAFVIDGTEKHEAITQSINNLGIKHIINEVEITVGCYTGIYYASAGDQDLLPSIRKAEMALSKAKTSTSSRFCFYNDVMSGSIERSFKIFNYLSRDLNDQKLYMVYQPIIKIEDHSICGFESLVRWNEKELGFISPIELIEVAENSGLIFSLGTYVVNQVAQFITNTTNTTFLGKFSINISGRELAQDDFSDKLITLISSYGIETDRIAIEVTETGIIPNIEVAKKHLVKLREVGFSIYLDDFGTGYSSLSYFDQLPIDVLKIDKVFLDEIIDNTKRQKLLKEMIRLAKSFKIETLAEGVETKEQFQMIEELGVDYVQGYYFSRPLDEDKVYDFIH